LHFETTSNNYHPSTMYERLSNSRYKFNQHFIYPPKENIVFCLVISNFVIIKWIEVNRVDDVYCMVELSPPTDLNAINEPGLHRVVVGVIGPSFMA